MNEWETSPAYQQHIAERRDHAAKLLADWGSVSNGTWPDGARFVSLTDMELVPRTIHSMLRDAEQSISRDISAAQLTRLFPNKDWHNWGHWRVLFSVAIFGNAPTYSAAPSPTLNAWFIGHKLPIRRGVFGCNHPNAVVVKSSNQFRKYHCPHCEHSWGEDSSD